MVLALQMTVPKAMLTLVQCLSADYPDHPKDLFQLRLTNVQSSFALENGRQDVRCAGLDTGGGLHMPTQQTANCCWPGMLCHANFAQLATRRQAHLSL